MTIVYNVVADGGVSVGGQGGQLANSTSQGGQASAGFGTTKNSGGTGGAGGGSNGGGGGVSSGSGTVAVAKKTWIIDVYSTLAAITVNSGQTQLYQNARTFFRAAASYRFANTSDRYTVGMTGSGVTYVQTIASFKSLDGDIWKIQTLRPRIFTPGRPL